MGFSRQEYWSGLPFPSPGDLPHPGIKRSAGEFFTLEPPGLVLIKADFKQVSSQPNITGLGGGKRWTQEALVSQERDSRHPCPVAVTAALSFSIFSPWRTLHPYLGSPPGPTTSRVPRALCSQPLSCNTGYAHTTPGLWLSHRRGPRDSASRTLAHRCLPLSHQPRLTPLHSFPPHPPTPSGLWTQSLGLPCFKLHPPPAPYLWLHFQTNQASDLLLCLQFARQDLPPGSDGKFNFHIHEPNWMRF